jgi:hypothetical protein
MGIFGGKRARKAKCTERGCAQAVLARGLCTRHYQAEYRRSGPPCTRAGCKNPSFARTLCVKHYQEDYRKQGRPCHKRGCKNPSFARRMCVRHYHRWYQDVLRERGVTGLKELPPKERRPAP